MYRPGMKGRIVAALAMGLVANGICQAHQGIQYRDGSWMKGMWTDNEAPYQKIRTEIGQASLNKERLRGIIAKMLQKCDTGKATSLDLFRWASAVLASSVTFDDWRRIDGDYKGKKPYSLFPSLAKSNSYEFTRVRFLFTAKFDFPHHDLVKIGEKLYSRNPSDVPVVRMLLHLYQPQAFPDERQRGIALVQKLESLDPGSLPTLTTASDFFRLCWMKSKNPADAEQAVSRSEIALRLTRSVEQKKIIEKTIAELRGS